MGLVPGYSRENGVFGPYKRSQISKVRVFRGVGSNFLQVRIEDAVAADNIFYVLMGDEVEPRREFIEKNAKYVRNLDV